MNIADVELTKLPAVPSVLVDLIEACSNPEISFDELARIIQQDAVLTARIVSVCNSAAYSHWQGDRSFNQLLVLLGLDAIKTIAVTAAVRQFFSQFSSDQGKCMGGLWRRSLDCASVARSLARLTGYQPVEEAYLAGLLHNLGQMIFLQEYGKQYAEMLVAGDSSPQLFRLERETFGRSTPELGAHLTRQWLPDSFSADAIRFQRAAAERLADSPNLVKILNLACALVVNAAKSPPATVSDSLFGLNDGILADLLLEAREEVRGILATHGFEDDSDPAVDDQKAREALGQHVRDRAMVGAIGGTPDPSDADWDQLLINFSILFEVSVLAGFEYQPEHNRLAGCTIRGVPNATRQVKSLQLPVQPNRNLVAQACLDSQILSTLDKDLPARNTVIDQQLQRLLGQPELLALPLVNENGLLMGALLVGLQTERLNLVLQQRSLLQQFLKAAAQRLQQQKGQSQEQADMLETQATEFQASSRRMVHEANNPLGIIKNYLHILGKNLGQEHAAREQIDIVKEEIERVADILLRMRDIGSEVQIDENEVDINILLTDLVSIFRESLLATKQIRCELNLDPHMPAIPTNRNSVKQIVTNLLKNAAEALGPEGRIHVQTRSRVILNEEANVQIVVSDDGPGIPGEVLDNIFKPIESHKGPGHSGLGLAIVKNLVTGLGGNIFVRTSDSGGTQFEILLRRG